MEIDPTLSLYRPNVGIVLINRRGEVWLGRRVGSTSPYRWQFPQGGVDDGEDLLAAALRELAEETGVTSVQMIGRTVDWITYDFPPEAAGSKVAQGWRGQRQAWFAMRFTGEDSEIDLAADKHIEFDAWRWDDIDEAPGLVAPFKREAYETVVRAFRPLAAPF
ncbi:MAG: RNA pyrophosphohydrolase [Caulobacteraceae bacterium]